jgi:hypothetical protein
VQYDQPGSRLFFILTNHLCKIQKKLLDRIRKRYQLSTNDIIYEARIHSERGKKKKREIQILLM